MVAAVKEQKQKVVLSLLPKIRKIAGEIYRNLPEGASVDLEDLIHEGVLAVLKAFGKLKKGSIDKNGNLSAEAKSFLLIRAKGAMFDYLRSLDFGSKQVRRKEKEIEQIRETLREKLGREPTEEELAKELNISSEELFRLEEKIGFSYILSLEEIFNTRLGKGFENFLPSEGEPEREVEKRELLKKLTEALKLLEENELLILQLLFYENLKTREVAKVLDISPGRVSQIKKQALKKLENYLKRFV
jgi:RNA polymerase sigma factor for flagellar operon FliA